AASCRFPASPAASRRDVPATVSSSHRQLFLSRRDCYCRLVCDARARLAHGRYSIIVFAPLLLSVVVINEGW
ncbi:unnamed protein product, partial [Callosobruchus maculatus]